MKITIDIDDAKVSCLLHDLTDIPEWINQMIEGKVNNCKKRMFRQWQPKLLADPDVTSISGTEDGLLSQILLHKDYKNRADRDAE